MKRKPLFDKLTILTMIVLTSAVVGCSSDPEAPDDTQPEKPPVSEPTPTPKPDKPNGRAVVLKHGWDIPTANGLAKMRDEFNASPFDGVMFSGRIASNTFTSDKLSATAIDDALKPLDNVTFKPNTKHYMMIYTNSVKGGFNGPNLNNLVNNLRYSARAAKKRGIEGLAFDNEVYKGNPWDMPQACPGLDRKDCGEAAFKAGKRIMQAIIEEWPEVKLMSFFGPWIEDPRTYKYINKYAPAANWSSDRDRDIGSEFLIGIFAATVGTKAQYIDGGELYGLRKREHYAKTAYWMKEGMVKDSPYIPQDLKQPYKDRIKIAFGLYDDREPQYTSIPKVTPQIWKSMIEGATQEADIVWLYTEIHDWWKTDGNDWPTKGGREGTEGYVTKDWYDATINAVK